MAGPNRGGPAGPQGRGRRGFGLGPCGASRMGPGFGPAEEALGRLGQGGGRYRRSILEVAILSSLAETTSHGYDLLDQLEALAADLVCIDAGSMYRLLRVMEEDGLVTSSWEMPDSGPSRRVYKVTDRGLEVLELMAHALEQRAASMQRLADRARQVAAKTRKARSSTSPSDDA